MPTYIIRITAVTTTYYRSTNSNGRLILTSNIADAQEFQTIADTDTTVSRISDEFWGEVAVLNTADLWQYKS